jgi:uncharacterized protein (DUF1697 family)
MHTFISLLRGINVSGQKKIRMEELRHVYEALHLANVQTYVQSGNVVFDTEDGDAAVLAGRIEAQIEQTFGFSVPVLLRQVADFSFILHNNPFLNDRNVDSDHLYLTFLAAAPPAQLVGQLKAPGDGDEFVLVGREIFVFCPNGYGRTKLNNNFFEKKLKLYATTRNWKTVNALYEMAND